MLWVLSEGEEGSEGMKLSVERERASEAVRAMKLATRKSVVVGGWVRCIDCQEPFRGGVVVGARWEMVDALPAMPRMLLTRVLGEAVAMVNRKLSSRVTCCMTRSCLVVGVGT